MALQLKTKLDNEYGEVVSLLEAYGRNAIDAYDLVKGLAAKAPDIIRGVMGAFNPFNMREAATLGEWIGTYEFTKKVVEAFSAYGIVKKADSPIAKYELTDAGKRVLIAYYRYVAAVQ
ncbi:MAG: hypothetical protein QXR73_03845 [Candidatus Micrarchaeaceae archaeon]